MVATIVHGLVKELETTAERIVAQPGQRFENIIIIDT
jgi:hypothetical protein